MRISLSILAVLTALFTIPLSAAEQKAVPSAEETITVSPAEKLLWQAKHLANISQPSALQYKFEKSGSLEEPFNDTVELQVTKTYPDGACDTQGRFFSGSRLHPIDPQEKVTGNPVLGFYLLGDIHEMKRLTEGGWPYFQRRIKTALAETADMQPTTVKYNGQDVSGTRVKIAPYRNDPLGARFGKFTEKTYEFIFSDKVPGSLYQITTFIPDPAAKGDTSHPLIQERLTLADVRKL